MPAAKRLLELSPLLEKPDTADCNVSGEGSTDRDDPNAAELFQIEGSLDAVRSEIGKGEPDRGPSTRRTESLAIGLPGTTNVRGAKMEIILFAVAKDVDFDALPPTRIDAVSLWTEVESNL